MTITTDIVIVSYKDKEELKRCIDSVEKNCKSFNLIIEDNNEPLLNRGFTKACNDGIKKGKAPFIWLLNSDAVIVDSETQQALINRFSLGPDVGLVGSQQLDMDNPDRIRFGGVLRAFPSGIHDGGLVSMGHCRVPKKQTWVNFASVMISRSMVDVIGLMDESMYLVYSDSDYCYYARSRGYSVWYEPRSRVYHKLNASKGVTEWHKKDMEAYMKKWGIVAAEGNFQISEQFHRLDMFP